MALNNFDEDQFDQERFGNEGVPPEPERKHGNRSFLIAIGIIGVIFVLALVLLLIVAPGLLANQRAAQQEQVAQINAANTATAMAATAMAVQPTPVIVATATRGAVGGGAIPTKTPVVAIKVNTPVSSGTKLSASELATVSALQTQMAKSGSSTGLTPTPTTSTALPKTGFADEVGLPTMAGMAVILVIVIMLSRKLRTSTR
ncbi:MAG: LPXTG cell wall anchor domain-containing protein [Chloroflexi bacterium]|nr:LPXTG cell wall anchor domain-containing protein [Chloroflexota bacterium]